MQFLSNHQNNQNELFHTPSWKVRTLLQEAPPWMLLLVGLICFSPLIEGGTTHIAVMIIRLFILVWMSIYWWRGVQTGRVSYWTSLHLLFVLSFLVIAIGATASSPYLHQSLQWFLVLSSYAVLLYLIVIFLSTWDHMHKLLIVMCAVGLLEVAWALVQAAQGMLRPTGTFFNPNFLACYVAVTWTLLLAYVVYLPGRHFVRKSWKESFATTLMYVSWPILLLMAIAFIIVQTGSRGAVVALLAGTMVILGIRFGWKGQSCVLIVLCTMVLVPNPLQQRVIAEHHRNPATYSRIQMWEGATQEMVDHPFGVGLGVHRYIAPQYAFPIEGQIIRFAQVSRTAHNEFLQVGLEIGVLGLLVFVGGILVLTVDTMKVLRRRLTRVERTMVVGAGGGVVIILTHAMVDSNLHVPSIAIVLTVLMAMLVSASRLTRIGFGSVREWHVKRPAVWGGLGVACLGLSLFFILKLGLAWIAYESGLEAMQVGNYPKAMTAYQKAVSMDPRKALYHSALASVYFQKFQRSGNLTNAEQAITELKQAIELNPLDGRVYALLGHVLSTVGSSHVMNISQNPQQDSLFQESYNAYHTSLQYEPFSVTTRLELARISLLLDKRTEGEAFIQEAIVLEPNFLPGREWLAKRMWNSGRREEALGQFQEIMRRKALFKDRIITKREQRFLRVDVRSLEVLAKSAG